MFFFIVKEDLLLILVWLKGYIFNFPVILYYSSIIAYKIISEKQNRKDENEIAASLKTHFSLRNIGRPFFKTLIWIFPQMRTHF